MRGINYASYISRKNAQKRKKWEMISLIFLYILVIILMVVLSLFLYDRLFRRNFQSTVKPWLEAQIGDRYAVNAYDLDLFPDIYNEENYGNVLGNVTISITFKSLTKFILFHCINISVIETKVEKNNLPFTRVINTFYYENNSYCVFELGNMIPANTRLTVKISFKSQYMKKSLVTEGLFLSTKHNKLTDINNTVLWTELWPFGARRIFPCADEPRQKSFFTLHLTHSEKYTALSNMPLKYKEYVKKRNHKGHNLVKSHFYKSVKPFSSYLLSFVISNSHMVRNFSLPNRPIFIYALNDTSHETFTEAFVKTVGSTIQTILHQLEDLFHFKDPWPKTEVIFINDFSPSAMESWGLITFRTLPTYNSRKQENFTQELIKITIHELCHIWFGNIITNQIWAELWLNEGLSTYCEITMFQNLYSHSNNIITQMVSYRSILREMYEFPIVKNKLNPLEGYKVDQVYLQSAGLLLWAENIMGRDNFIDGIRDYIHQYQYKSVKGYDFWNIHEKRKTGISQFYRWFLQAGHPIVSVKLCEDHFQFQQKQQIGRNMKFEIQLWPIWLLYIKSDAARGRNQDIAFFNSEEMDTRLGLNESQFDQFLKNYDSWIQFNIDGVGFYVVNYDIILWQKICRALETNPGNFTKLQKLVLLEDARHLVIYRHQDIIYLLDLLKYLHNESDIDIWNNFGEEIANAFGHHPVTLKYGKIFERSLNLILAHNSTAYDPMEKKILYKRVACGLELKSCWKLCAVEMLKFIENTNDTHLGELDISETLKYGLLFNKSRQVWLKLFQIHKQHKMPLQSLLVSSSSEDFITVVLEIVRNKEKVQLNYDYQLGTVLWRFVITNCTKEYRTKETQRLAEACDYLIKDVLPYLVLNFVNTEEEKTQLNKFLKEFRYEADLLKNIMLDDELLSKTISRTTSIVKWCENQI